MYKKQVQSLEKEMATYSNILAWKIQVQRSLVGYSPWDHNELDMTEHACILSFIKGVSKHS